MTLWDKLKIWLKVAVLSAVGLYLLVFVILNTGAAKDVTLWVWYNKNPKAPLLVVLPITFLFGVVCTLLTRTIWRTMRQLRDMKRRKMEKEAAAIITRAAKLRVREQQGEAAAGRGFPVVEPDEPLA